MQQQRRTKQLVGPGGPLLLLLCRCSCCSMQVVHGQVGVQGPYRGQLVRGVGMGAVGGVRGQGEGG